MSTRTGLHRRSGSNVDDATSTISLDASSKNGIVTTNCRHHEGQFSPQQKNRVLSLPRKRLIVGHKRKASPLKSYTIFFRGSMLMSLSCLAIVKLHLPEKQEQQPISCFEGSWVSYTVEKSYPRILIKDSLQTSSHSRVLSIEQSSEPLSSDDYYHNSRWPEEEDGCTPAHDWQVTSFSTCNTLHEIDLQFDAITNRFDFINEGGAREAYRLSLSPQQHGRTVVLKTNLYGLNHKEYLYEEQRMDALSMERLTSSPHIMDVYAHCGMSLVTEYSAGGTLYHLLKLARQGFVVLSPLQKLQLAVQVVAGVADLHAAGIKHNNTSEEILDGNQEPYALAHADVCCHQYLLVNGIYKLNDFNHARFSRVHVPTRKPCLESSRMSYLKIRPPEEMQQEVYYPLDKVDVYMMGNVLYYILTQQWLFEGLSRKKTMKALRRGKRSPFPSEVTESENQAVVGLRQAVEMCWIHSPFERPTAREVELFLRSKLLKLVGETDSDDTSLEGRDKAAPSLQVYVPQVAIEEAVTDDFYVNM